MKTHLDLSLKRHGALFQSLCSPSGRAQWASSGMKVELKCLWKLCILKLCKDLTKL